MFNRTTIIRMLVIATTVATIYGAFRETPADRLNALNTSPLSDDDSSVIPANQPLTRL